jgi:hypothetical protein
LFKTTNGHRRQIKNKKAIFSIVFSTLVGRHVVIGFLICMQIQSNRKIHPNREKERKKEIVNIDNDINNDVKRRGQ